MYIRLTFDGSESPTVQIEAQTDAERAILGFLAEGYQRRWRVANSYNYRPGGVARIVLVEDRTPPADPGLIHGSGS